jgi:HSP20 family protein
MFDLWEDLGSFFDFEKDFEKFFGFHNRSRQHTPRHSSGIEYEWSPLTDIYEDNDFFKFKIDLPGVEKEDVKIKYSNGRLTVWGIRKPEHESENFKYHKIEKPYGRFYREYEVPLEINEDKISAEFNNGQLIISLPKENVKKSDIIEIPVK